MTDADFVCRGLFQLMWLASASTSPRSLKITDVLKTDRVDVRSPCLFLRWRAFIDVVTPMRQVTKLFLLHFEKHWKKDNYVCVYSKRSTACVLFNEAHRALCR